MLLLVGAGAVFIEGSELFDQLSNSSPEQATVVAATLSDIPDQFSAFRAGSLRGYSLERKESPASATAEIALVLKDPLYREADWTEAAAAYGDDAAAYRDAVVRRNELPRTTAPKAPPERPPQRLYATAKPPGDELVVTVGFTAIKARRGWSLHDCVRVWSGGLGWRITNVRWPGLPEEYAALQRKWEIRRDAGIVGEPSGELLLKSFVEERRAFVAAIQNHESESLKRVVRERLEDEVSRVLAPTEAFKLISLDLPSDTKATAFEVKIGVGPTAEIFLPADEEAARWLRDPLRERYNQAKGLADEFLPDIGSIPTASPLFYRPVAPAEAAWSGRVRVERQGPSHSPTIRSVAWLDTPGEAHKGAILAKQATAGAVFLSADPTLHSAEHYRSDVEQFVARVEADLAALERRWGNDREAWRLLTRAVAAHGGKAAIVGRTSYTELVVGSQQFSRGRVFQFNGNRSIQLPFRWFDDLIFTDAKLSFRERAALNDIGCWREPNGAMRAADLVPPAAIPYIRNRCYAEHILWHLLAETNDVFTVASVSGSDPAQVRVQSLRWPEITVAFDPQTGCVASSSYTDQIGRSTKAFRWEFSGFRKFEGVTRAAEVQLTVDGNLERKYTVAKHAVAEISGEVFRNPYSPGRPFRGNPQAKRYSVKVTNGNVAGAVLVCVDDDPNTVPLSLKESYTYLLPEGEHHVVVVGWIPQLSLSEPHRVERRETRFSLSRNGELFAYVSNEGGGALALEVR